MGGLVHRSIKRFFSPLRGNLLALTLSITLWLFPHMMVTPYESLYFLALGGSGALLGLMNTVQSMLGIGLKFSGGSIADRRGRKKVIGIVTIMLSFFYFFYIFARSWVWVFIGASLLSLRSLYTPALQAIRADSVKPRERGRGFIFFSVLPRIPAIIAPALGGMLMVDLASNYGISLEGVRLGFILVFIGAFSAGLVRLTFLEETLEKRRHGHDSAKKGLKTFLREWCDAIASSKSDIKRLILLNGFFMFCFHFDPLFRDVYAVKIKSIPADQWGIIVSIAQAFMIVAALVMGGLIDRYGSKHVFVPSVFFLGLANLMFILGETFTSILLSMVIINTFQMTRMMSFQVLMADSTPREIRGRVFSIIEIFGNIGWSISYMLSGILFDMSPTLPFIVSVVTYSMATLVGLFFIREAEVKYE